MSTVIAALFASGLIAGFRADVIKIEAPEKRDTFRKFGSYYK
ncbi:CoA transferase [Clostridium sp. Mt-5]|uniref:CoA transferase n=1 Tax=Clostridium moutaii TaxID=3240932 RepID=A0ABV4BMY9_9CLOT